MKHIINIIGLLFICSVTFAQIIKGTIKDERHEPLSNASISVRGTFLGTVSNPKGEFDLKMPGEGEFVLVVNAVGYESAEKAINTRSTNSVEFVLTRSFSSLKEITVTASRKPEIVDRTPASVQIVNAAEIRSQSMISPNISNVLAQSIPALAFGTNTTSNTGQTLRGRTPLILVDGIPQSTPLRAGAREIRTIDPAVIDRIEVVKGATAIYGNGADGGVINYITRKPTSGSSFNAYSYIAGTMMPINGSGTPGTRLTQQFSGTTKNFDYIVNGTYEKTGVLRSADGKVITPVYGLGESDIFNAFTKLGYNITPKQRVELMYNYFGSTQNTDYVEQTGKYLETPTIGIKGESIGEKEGTKYNHNAYLKYLVKDIVGKTSLDMSAYLQSFYTIYGFTSFFEEGGQSTIKSNKQGFRVNANSTYKISNSFEGDLVYGVDVLKDKTSQPLTDGRTWVPEMDLLNAAPYVQASATIVNDLIFKAGFRYDHINVDIPAFTQVRDAAGGGGQHINGGKLSFEASTFNTGLRFAKWELFNPFISYTQGFSIIDIGRYVRAAKENDISNMEIQPVVVQHYEAGFSSNLGWLNFSGSYFLSTNKIGASLIEVNGAYIQQKAPEKTYGVEASIDVKPTENITLGVAYVYVEGKADINRNNDYNDASDAYLTSMKISPPKTAAYIRWAPEKTVILYVQYLRLDDRSRFARRSNGRYGYGEGPVEGVEVFNFSGNWQLNKKIQLNLGIENLFNKDYFTPLAQWSAQDADYSKANGMRMQLGIGIKW